MFPRPAVAAAATLTALAFGPSAAAETIHEPAPGAVALQSQRVFFDWRWDEDQYATSSLIFTRTADGSNPTWFGPIGPDKVRVTDNYGLGFDYSNTYVVPSSWGITPGNWYWRPCSKSINGEDDKCYQRVEPRLIVILPDPPPPTPPPTPPTTAPPAPEPPATAPPVSKPPVLTAAVAASAAKRELRRRLRLARTPRGMRMSCHRRTESVQACRASWRTRAHSYRGLVRVERAESTSATIDITRTTRKTGRKRYFIYY